MNLNLNISIINSINLLVDTRPHQLPRYFLSLPNVPEGARVDWTVARLDGRVLFEVGGMAGEPIDSHAFAHGRVDAPVMSGWCGTTVFTAVVDGAATRQVFYNLGVSDLIGQVKGRVPNFGELHPIILNDTSDEAYRTAVSTPDSYITVHPTLSGQGVSLTSDVVATVKQGIFDGRGATLYVVNHATKIEQAQAHMTAYVHFCDNTATPETDGLTYRHFADDAHVVVLHCSFTRCADGGLDVIWNNGNRVRVTIQSCRFENIDKACLIDSGSKTREGGRYRVDVMDTVFVRCKQRQVMIRNGTAVVTNSVIEAFGDALGNGTALNPATGASMHIEGCVIAPGKVGEESWNGEPFVKPRSLAWSSTPSPFMRVFDTIGCDDVYKEMPVVVNVAHRVEAASGALYRRVWREAGAASGDW